MKDSINSSSRPTRTCGAPSRFEQNGESDAAADHGGQVKEPTTARGGMTREVARSSGDDASPEPCPLQDLGQAAAARGSPSGITKYTHELLDFSDDSDESQRVGPQEEEESVLWSEEEEGTSDHDFEVEENLTGTGPVPRGSSGKGKGKVRADMCKAGAEVDAVVGKKTKLQVAASKALRSRSIYQGWPVFLLQKVCRLRGISGMSKVKEKEVLVTKLSREDRVTGGKQPHFAALEEIMEGVTAPRTATGQSRTVHDGLALTLRSLLADNYRREPSKTHTWDSDAHVQAKILAVIDEEDAKSVDAATDPVAPGCRKTRHCLMRLVCLMADDKHRGGMIESQLAANRGELDVKATGASRRVWRNLAEDFRNPALKIPRLFHDELVANCDPNVCAQPNISEQKLYDMWTDAKKAWNSCHANFKASGSHGNFDQFCSGSKDIFIVQAAAERIPALEVACTNMMPEGVQREFSGTRTDRDTPAGNAETRAVAKRAGAAIYGETRKGKKKKAKDERSKSVGAFASEVIQAAASSLAPLFQQQRASQESMLWRARAEEAERKILDCDAKSRSLALELQRYKQLKEFSVDLQKEKEQLSSGTGGNKFMMKYLQKRVQDLRSMLGGDETSEDDL